MNMICMQYVEKLVVKARFHAERCDYSLAWRILEDAHIFSQPYVRSHMYVHAEMLRLAVAEKNMKEIWGQIIRIALAAPASILKRFPVGNTGRSDLGIFTELPLSKKNGDRIRSLEKMEKKRLENGGALPKYRRQFPITRR